MPTKTITFSNADGHQLASRLELPVGGLPRAYAIFAHCFTCGMEQRAAVDIARALCQQGIAVLRFDFTGLGKSEGDFADTTFSSNIADLLAASEFLRNDYQAPKLLVGHSLGGAAVLMAASQIPEVAAVATIGAPAKPDHVLHLLESAKPEIKEKGEAEVNLAGRNFRIKKQFLEDLDGHRMDEVIHDLKRPLLVCHAPKDNFVGIDNAGDIFAAAKHPKSFISLDNADHLLSNEEDSRYVAQVVAAWASRYLPIPAVRGAPDNRLTVSIGSQSYTSDVQVGHHRFLADEPESIGGHDCGPTPYDFLATALGTCTAMTLRMYADRKKWPLEGAIVHVDHAATHSTDCEGCEEKPKQIHKFERELELLGRLDEEQRKRLVQIADRCPVHKTLKSDIEIETVLRETTSA